MNQTRKLHRLTGTITLALLSSTKTKQPFYYLEIEQAWKDKAVIYAFANLVSQELWNTLKTENYSGKTYHFFCEKRVRGWRLRSWEEIN